MPDDIIIHPVQHVPGDFNPADIPTRAGSAPDDVREGSGKVDQVIWPFPERSGPSQETS